ncbi:hypothetical protein FKM82_005942 [Ascaphus truei]
MAALSPGSTVEGLRQRKPNNSSEKEATAAEEKPKDTRKVGRSAKYVALQRFAKLFFGCLAAASSGMMYVVYLSTYHERKFWSSSRRVRVLKLRIHVLDLDF